MSVATVAQGLPAELGDLVVKLDQDLAKIVHDFQKSLGTPGSGTIYHYTDDKGLRGILEAGTLWFTDVAAMNDPSEVKYGMAVGARSVFASVPQVIAPNVVKTYDVFTSTFRRFGQEGFRRIAHMVLCSFSTRTDDLGQWRSYADDGRGFAVGFDVTKLLIALRASATMPFDIFRVQYDPDLLASVMDALAMATLPLVPAALKAGHPREIIDDYMASVSATVSVYMLQVSMRFKHPAYKHEDEVRFLAYGAGNPAPDYKRRYRPYEVVRFLEFEWKKVAPDAVNAIVLGPSAAVTARGYVDDCLEAWMKDKFERNVTVSAIPYRTFR